MDEAVATAYIQTMLAQSAAKTKLIILDACRSRGHADAVANQEVKSAYHADAKMSWAQVNQTDSGGNMYSLYSSSEATVSFAGGAQGLSVMTEHLVPLITQRPGLELSALVKRLTKAVREAHGSSSGGRMLVNASPQGWEEEFYFVPP